MTDDDRPTPAGAGRVGTPARSLALVCVIGLLGAPAPPTTDVVTADRARLTAADRRSTSVVHAAAMADSKYYIVAGPTDGQKEFLFAIAAKTLGDGRRQYEILELNRGRLQPDGRQMTDLLTVEPGWILVLPPDARGEGVRTGYLPQAGATAAAPAAPTGSASRESSGLALDSHSNAASDPGSDVDAEAGVGSTVVAFVTSRTGALTFTALIFVSFLVGRRRRKSASRPARTTVAAAEPPSAAGPEPALAPLSEPGRTAESASHPGRVSPPVSDPSPAQLAPLRVDLRCGHDVAAVRLIGVRTVDNSSTAHRWLAPNQSPPPAAASVVLGHNAEGRLWVDLALAPDVLTINGHPDACRRQVIVLIDQLRRAGTPVTVVGDTLRPWLPADCHQVDSLSELDSASGRRHDTEVVVLAGAADYTMAAMHTLVKQGSRRIVPIVVGGVAPSRWSVRMALGESGAR